MLRVAPRVPSRGMHAKRAQPPPPPSKPAPRPAQQSSRPAYAATEAPRAPPPPPPPPPPPAPELKVGSASATAEQAAPISPQSAVLAKNISRIAGSSLKGSDLLNRLLTAAEKLNADVAATAAAFKQAVAVPSLAGILDEASDVPTSELRDFIAGKLPDVAAPVRRVIAGVASAGGNVASLSEAVSLLDTLNKATESDNLVLVLSSSEARARHWQAELSERLTSQLGRKPEFLFVHRAGDVDEFDLPNGGSLSRDNGATETTVRGLMSSEVTGLDRDTEGVNGQLQSLQPWVDPAKAAEELAALSSNKYARLLNLQLLRPKI